MDPLSRGGSREARETVKGFDPFIYSFFATMAKYTLKSGLSLDGVKYEAGEKVELNTAQVEELHEILDLTPTLEEDEDKGPSTPAYSKMKKADLVALLESKGAEFDPNAKNADLIAILEAMDAEAPSTPEGGAEGEGKAPEGETF